ncbi:CinA family protein [Limnohabitans sp. Rim8]|uniref:CinA family protein n=1 Tax=Limnohabitans sp. Rim8 TaxID=1100718 RepID=UPI0025E582B5|nr:CinA family protein [Limnohabitans sp. Rim8]
MHAIDHRDLEIILKQLTSQLAERLLQLRWMLSTAESCTGGMIATRCTDLAGSSTWFERGFVTYSNQSKTQMLGVPEDLIAHHGAVSAPVAKAMALGAVYRSASEVSIAVTGVAGPSGGSFEKPVGTVWLAWCISGSVHAEVQHFSGDRAHIRQATTEHALEGLMKRLPTNKPAGR